MVRKLLVGLNGSKPSQAALEFALRLAQTYDAAVAGLGVVDRPHLTAPEPVPLGAGAYKEVRDEAVLRRANENIDAALVAGEKACRDAGLACQMLKREGDPVQLLGYEGQRADLIVTGKRSVPGEGDTGSSIMERLLRHASVPLLCVPAGAPYLSPVLVAYDASLAAAGALHGFVSTGMHVARSVHILSLGPEANEQAGLAADYLNLHGVMPEVRVDVDARGAAARILAVAEQLCAGLIVMGAYGQPRFKEFLLGSVTKAVVASTKIPLFLTH